MMIFETFARRKLLASRQAEPELYIYDRAPAQLRHQIAVALHEGIGAYHVSDGYNMHATANANEYWEHIDRICRKEIYSYLTSHNERDLSTRFLNFTLRIEDLDDWLSAIELACIVLHAISGQNVRSADRGAELGGIAAIQEVNGRFEQHGIGYQFENRQIIRVDSKMVHAEVVKPTLRLLTAPAFVKANDDFMVAHQHYRASLFRDCVVSANRAFESMLKAICDLENWSYGKGDGASELITKVTSNGLFSHDFDRSFTAYIAMLKAGLPAVRNDAGGHGQGLAAMPVTAQIARFAINMTASNILFLGEAYAIMKTGSR